MKLITFICITCIIITSIGCKKAVVTQEEVNRLNEEIKRSGNLTYNGVKKIFGADGVPVKAAKKYGTTASVFEWNNPDGTYIMIVFLNGKTVVKKHKLNDAIK